MIVRMNYVKKRPYNNDLNDNCYIKINGSI